MTKEEVRTAIAEARAHLQTAVDALDADPQAEPRDRDQARQAYAAATSLAELLSGR